MYVENFFSWSQNPLAHQIAPVCEHTRHAHAVAGNGYPPANHVSSRESVVIIFGCVRTSIEQGVTIFGPFLRGEPSSSRAIVLNLGVGVLAGHSGSGLASGIATVGGTLHCQPSPRFPAHSRGAVPELRYGSASVNHPLVYSSL